MPTTGRRPREQPDGRGANYLADELGCALAEAFQDQVSPHVQVCPNYFSVAAAPTGVVRRFGPENVIYRAAGASVQHRCVSMSFVERRD